MTKLTRAVVWAIASCTIPTIVEAKTFAEIVNGSVVPLGNTIVSLIIALAFLFFLIGMVRYFMSHNAESRQQGRQHAIYGIAGLALLFVLWGIVRFLIGIVSSFNT